jgi:hypothetical protein
MLAEQNENK